MIIEKMYLSQEGLEAETFCKANNLQIEFTKFKLGDRPNATPENCILGNTSAEFGISSVTQVVDQKFRVRGILDNNNKFASFTFREIALMCKNPKEPEKEIVYCYGAVPTEEDGEIISSLDGAHPTSHTFEIDVRVSGNLASFTVDDSAKADAKSLQELKEQYDKEGFIIDNQERFIMWVKKSGDRDYSNVRILKGEYTYTEDINLSTIGTKSVEGLGEVIINNNIKYDPAPEFFTKIKNINIKDNHFINCQNLINCKGILDNCKNSLDNNNITFDIPSIFNKDVEFNGNIIQNGEAYETHTEKLYTKKDLIITRDKAKTGLKDGEMSGIIAHKYDSDGNDGILGFNNKGVARVGDRELYYTSDGLKFYKKYDQETGGFLGEAFDKETIVPEPIKIETITVNGIKIQVCYSDKSQALATRDEEELMDDKRLVVWNSTEKRLETKVEEYIVDKPIKFGLNGEFNIDSSGGLYSGVSEKAKKDINENNLIGFSGEFVNGAVATYDSSSNSLTLSKRVDEIKIGGTYSFVKIKEDAPEEEYLPDYGKWRFLSIRGDEII